MIARSNRRLDGSVCSGVRETCYVASASFDRGFRRSGRIVQRYYYPWGEGEAGERAPARSFRDAFFSRFTLTRRGETGITGVNAISSRSGRTRTDGKCLLSIPEANSFSAFPPPELLPER